ncbi:MAG TPA: nuclear transport factor 2 family protein [Acidimicrobiales bacterium]|jgi:hypothetical protein|nr:nuclear transport factor 2 family protein [Acidimicrobiales bacterium]
MTANVEVDLGVRNLTGRYCDAVARFDVDAFAACWSSEATWTAGDLLPIQGRDAIVRVFTKLRAPFHYCIQELLSGVVTPTGEGSDAIAQWQVRELQWREDGTVGCVIGTYADRIVMEDAAWCFADRHFTLVYRGPVDLTGPLSVRQTL